ncbi:MAG: hypothetical protein WC872_04975 [Candidatus Absconditabacterales bacterium]
MVTMESMKSQENSSLTTAIENKAENKNLNKKKVGENLEPKRNDLKKNPIFKNVYKEDPHEESNRVEAMIRRNDIRGVDLYLLERGYVSLPTTGDLLSGDLL